MSVPKVADQQVQLDFAALREAQQAGRRPRQVLYILRQLVCIVSSRCGRTSSHRALPPARTLTNPVHVLPVSAPLANTTVCAGTLKSDGASSDAPPAGVESEKVSRTVSRASTESVVKGLFGGEEEENL